MDNKGSTMQSGSGGIKKEPAEVGQPANQCPPKSQSNAPSDQDLQKAVQKAKNLANKKLAAKAFETCWICKSQGLHTTKACPQHPKNKKKNAEAITPGGKTKPPRPIEKLIAENKCMYCGVQGHFIGNCPVKNWGKGPEAESATQNQAGSSQGVKVEPMDTQSEAPSSPIQTQAISTETKPTNQQSTPGIPQIVPGSAISLAQGVKVKKKRRGLKRNRGSMINGVRMPYYKPALLHAERAALRALMALEEKPLVIKRERTDSTEDEADATLQSPSPQLAQTITPKIEPEDPQSPSSQTSVPTVSAKSLPGNPNPSPTSATPRILRIVPRPPPPLTKPLPQTLPKNPNPSSSSTAPRLPRPPPPLTKPLPQNFPRNSNPSPASATPRLPRPPLTKPLTQSLPRNPNPSPTSATLRLPRPPPPLTKPLPQTLPTNPNPFPTSTAPRIQPRPMPPSREPLPQTLPMKPNPSPTSPTSRMPRPPPPLTKPLPQNLPTNPNPSPTSTAPHIVPGPPPSSRKPVPQTLPTNPNPSSSTGLPSLINHLLLPLVPLPNPCANATTVPTKKKRKRRGLKRNGGSRLSDGTRMPKYKPAKVRAMKEALAALKEEAPEPEREKTDPTDTSQSATRPLSSPAPKKSVTTKIVTNDLVTMRLSAKEGKLYTLKAEKPHPKLSAKIVRKDSQQPPAPVPPCIVPSQSSSPVPSKIVPKTPQQPPATAPPRILQGPRPSSAPTKAVSAEIAPKDPQPPADPGPSRIVQGSPLSSAPTKAVTAKIVPKDPQPPPVPVPPCIVQSPSLFPAPSKDVSAKIVPETPQLSPASAPPSILQGSSPSPISTEAMPAQIMSTNPEPPKARAPLRILLGSTPSPAPSKEIPPQLSPSRTVPEQQPVLSERLLEPPSPPQFFGERATMHLSAKQRKKRRRKAKKPNLPKWFLEQRATQSDLKEAPELEIEKTAAQKAFQKSGETAPIKTTDVGNPTEAKPIPNPNAAELEELKKQTQEIEKRQQEIREQKILYTTMLKAQLAMCSPLAQNVQYPGFTLPMSNAVPTPVPRATVPVTIVNHPNAAVQIPVKPGQNPVGPVRTLAPVNIVEKAKEPPKQPSDVNIMHHFTNINHYPAGVPRSFLGPLYQEHIKQHKKEQMGLKQQEKELIKQQRQIEKAAQNLPQSTDPSEQKAEASGFVPIQENSRDASQPRTYSPSDVYGDVRNESGSTEPHEGSESPDPHGQKRLSAFKRLGPVTAPKKPKLTINLKCNTDQAVREVVDETEPEVVEEHTPVHLRNDVTTSTDETVMKYLFFWPWKKTVPVRRTASFKNSKSAMLLEQEQMEELYDKDNIFIQITVTNYPRHWTKDDVFDVLLEQINFIPCFIEFTSHECKFLVVRSKPALLAIHKMGFKLRKEDLELNLSISVTTLSHNQLDFVPRLVLRRRLNMAYDGQGKLDLREFTLKSDLSHFIYFPLRRLSHQTDLIQLQSVVEWDRLTELNLSHNRLTSIDGFDLNNTSPHLKTLDLSYNHLERVTVLLRCRNLPLTSISLEGNPLCHDYTDPAEYVKVVRMLFPAIRVLDGVTIHLKGDLPTFNKNFCLYGAENIVEKFLETFFPLLEAQPADRLLIDEMYDENALMTVLYRYKYIHRHFRVSCSNSQFVDDGVKDVVAGAGDVTKYIHKWPGLKHDPFTFTVDVLFHSDTTTVIKICGILKLTSETLAEDEPVIAFSRTTLLHTKDGVEYKIQNELLLWDEPTNECHDNAFQVTKIRSKKLYIDLEFDSAPDEESKEKLIAIFGHLTELDKNASRRCLEKKEWNLRSALDNFIQLLKLNDLSSITYAGTPTIPPRPSVRPARQLVPLTQ